MIQDIYRDVEGQMSDDPRHHLRGLRVEELDDIGDMLRYQFRGENGRIGLDLARRCGTCRDSPFDLLLLSVQRIAAVEKGDAAPGGEDGARKGERPGEDGEQRGERAQDETRGSGEASLDRAQCAPVGKGRADRISNA